MLNSHLQNRFTRLTMRAVICGALVLATVPAFAQDGAAQFKQRCQMCHGASGAGDTPTGKSMKLRSLLDPDVVKLTDAQLIEVTTNGRNKMPPYKEKMSDAQIKDVVAFIRTLQKK